MEPYVVKRDGSHEPTNINKIFQRLDPLLDIEPILSRKDIDVQLVANRGAVGLFPVVKTSELDILAAETAVEMTTTHCDYALFAGRIALSNLQKQAPKKFSEAVRQLNEYIDPQTKEPRGFLSKRFVETVQKHADLFDSWILPLNDFTYDYFGFKTLERSYLLKTDKGIVETPQYMLMRVAIGLHFDDLDAVKETYTLLSQKTFTHATPTLFNAGSEFCQMSSCFLMTMCDDSLDGIYDTLKRCALISKYAGGIGISVSNIRASGTYIKGTNGRSNGLVPMLRVFDATSAYVDQGGGKRKGSIAIYLEPWHADVFEFLDLKKPHGKEELRARNLFYALWICDLFMKRVKAGEKWSLFCPKEAPLLLTTYGEEFERAYENYENIAGLARKTVPARDLWDAILVAQIESGVPYMTYKDSANSKSNQKNIGMIMSSNLCTEVMQVADTDHVAVCNLASISLPSFITASKQFDEDRFVSVVKVAAKNCDKMIDLNYYPIPEAKLSNDETRNIGLGIQGFADALLMQGYAFDSQEAMDFNVRVFEAFYFAAVTASMELAKRYGPYPKYAGSPASQGLLQFDLWGVTPSGRWDWTSLKADIAKYGLRNSLLIAPMPTASTSQILGNNECFEPYTSNIYTRRVLSGEYVVVNKHLVYALEEIGLWNVDIKNRIVREGGSIQAIEEIPDSIKRLFKTAWELSMKTSIDLAAARAPFIDQSQSLNAFMGHPTMQKLTSMHFYAWEKGLKTGMYYLRTLPATDAAKVTVEPVLKRTLDPGPAEQDPDPAEPENKTLRLELCTKEEGCISCGS